MRRGGPCAGAFCTEVYPETRGSVVRPCGPRCIRCLVTSRASCLHLRVTIGMPWSEDMWFNLIIGTGFKTSYIWNLTTKRFVCR